MEQIISVLLKATGASAFSNQMAQMASSAAVTQRAVMQLQNTMGMVKTAVAGAIGGFTLGAFADLGMQFENTQNKMAGFLTALGYTNNDFNAGLQISAGLMKKIELSAAALPGEAEDYIRVFTTALPAIEKSVGGSLDDMVAFSNRMAAIGATFGIDSMQVSHDLMRMLQVGRGGAGLDVRTFTEMLPFLKQVQGYANLTTESFNKLNEQARAQLLQKAMGQLGPMIEGAQNSYDALKGTVVATFKTMTRMATTPLFDGMKRGLAGVAAAFMDADGNLTGLGNTVVTIGKMMSTALVNGVEAAVAGTRWLIHGFSQLLGLVQQTVLPVFQTKIDMVVDALPALGNALDVLTGTFEPLVHIVLTAASALQPMTDAVLGFALTALPPLVQGFSGFVDMLGVFIPWFAEMLSNIFGWIVPPVIELGGAIGKLIKGIFDFVGPILGVLVGGVLKMAEYIAPVVGFLIDRLAAFGSGLGEILSYLGDIMRRWFGMETHAPAKTDASEKVGKAFAGLQDMIRNFNSGVAWAAVNLSGSAAYDASKKGGAGAARVPNPAQRGGTKVVQDFRNSRFTIDQKFEEGFDPDRVGVAFVSSVQKAGEKRLQSGFEPLFGVY